MEWKGVNLTKQKQQQWAKRSLLQLIQTGATILCSLLLSATIYMFGQHFSHQNQTMKTQQDKNLAQLSQLEQQINFLKANNAQPLFAHLLTKAQVRQFIDYLNHIAIQGGAEIIQLYLEDGAKVKIVGKSHSQVTFEQLENQLKTQKLHFQLDHFQTNDKNQVEFNITISLGNKKDDN